MKTIKIKFCGDDMFININHIVSFAKHKVSSNGKDRKIVKISTTTGHICPDENFDEIIKLINAA